LTLPQRAGDRRFASVVELLETERGEQLVRFAYSTGGKRAARAAVERKRGRVVSIGEELQPHNPALTAPVLKRSQECRPDAVSPVRLRDHHVVDERRVATLGGRDDELHRRHPRELTARLGDDTRRILSLEQAPQPALLPEPSRVQLEHSRADRTFDRLHSQPGLRDCFMASPVLTA
jgi:hypothetical protein